MFSKFVHGRDFHIHLEGALVIPIELKHKVVLPKICWPHPGADAIDVFLMTFRNIRAKNITVQDITLIVKSSVEHLPKWFGLTGADLRIGFRFWASLLGKSDDPHCLHDAFHAVVKGIKQAVLPDDFDLTVWASVSRRGGEIAVKSLSQVVNNLNLEKVIDIIGIDLAGSEKYPSTAFLEYASDWCRNGGLFAIHAGETPYQPYSQKNVFDAINACPNRIGHCLIKDKHLWQEIVYRNITIERCPLAYLRMLPPAYFDYLTIPQNARHLVVTGSDDPVFLS